MQEDKCDIEQTLSISDLQSTYKETQTENQHIIIQQLKEKLQEMQLVPVSMLEQSDGATYSVVKNSVLQESYGQLEQLRKQTARRLGEMRYQVTEDHLYRLYEKISVQEEINRKLRTELLKFDRK